MEIETTYKAEITAWEYETAYNSGIWVAVTSKAELIQLDELGYKLRRKSEPNEQQEKLL